MERHEELVFFMYFIYLINFNIYICILMQKNFEIHLFLFWLNGVEIFLPSGAKFIIQFLWIIYYHICNIIGIIRQRNINIFKLNERALDTSEFQFWICI